jgi:hypothetical protein
MTGWGWPPVDAGGRVERDVASERDGEQAAWRDLVARLESPVSVDPASAPWPDRENLGDGTAHDRDAGPAADRGRIIRPAGLRRPAEPLEAPEPADLDEAGDLAAADIGDDSDDRYVPPPLAPLPPADPVTRGAWVALFGGPGYLFVAAILGWQLGGWAESAAIAAFVIGFVMLVFRLGDGPSRRDGPDQGAVV